MIYRVKTNTIVHEQIDDEVIIINMNTGHYYSLRGSGSAIWSDLVAGTDPDHLVAALERGFHDPDGAIGPAVNTLLDDLLKAEIIDQLDEPLPEAGAAPTPVDAAGKPPFEAPSFETFSDVQELLLLDPIHDVSESGWPMNKDAGDPSP